MVCVPFETQDANNQRHSEVFFFSFSAGEMLKVVSALWIWQPGWVMYRLPPADLKRKVQADWKILIYSLHRFSFWRGGKMSFWISVFQISDFVFVADRQSREWNTAHLIEMRLWSCYTVKLNEQEKHPHTEICAKKICDLFNLPAHF